MSSRLPNPPTAARLRGIGIREDEFRIVRTDSLWWRVHRTAGDHVLAWSAFRQYGPLLRFDPHPPPVREHRHHSVWYGASTPLAALAEAFQADRTVDRFRGRPYLTGLRCTREVHLLDLATDSSGTWATRAGGTYALTTGPHSITQRWARRIADAFPNLDGLHYNSRFAGAACAVLFAPAAAAMPRRPAVSLPLAHPGLALRIAGASRSLGHLVV